MWRVEVYRSIVKHGGIIVVEHVVGLWLPELPEDIDTVVEEAGGDHYEAHCINQEIIDED